jgi:hypothetical protein
MNSDQHGHKSAPPTQSAAPFSASDAGDGPAAPRGGARQARSQLGSWRRSRVSSGGSRSRESALTVALQPPLRITDCDAPVSRRRSVFQVLREQVTGLAMAGVDERVACWAVA